jgi:hypothetical protein
MEWLSKELLDLLYNLLPGFLAAWVFYALTAHPKPSPFERVVQALVFTVIVRALIIMVRGVCLHIGRWHTIGVWDAQIDLVVSLVVAVLLGLLFAEFANKDRFHGWIRKLGWSTRTSFPSEWYSAFYRFTRERHWVVLHLKGERRLFGWPEEWPDEPDHGHFIIEQPEWLLTTGERAPLHNVERFIVAAGEVEMVEFVRADEEVTTEPSELQRVNDLLTGKQEMEHEHGNKGPSASAESAE